MFRPMNEKFQDMKLRKFQVGGISWENILGHLQGENFELKKKKKTQKTPKTFHLKFSYFPSYFLKTIRYKIFRGRQLFWRE